MVTHPPRRVLALGKTADLDPSERYCTCCSREIDAIFRWLELDQRTNTYHDRRDVPEGKSQGWFPFGLKCARRLAREAAEAL